MSTTDYIFGIAALALVLWNMRPHALTDRSLRRPLIIAGAVGFTFLHTIPTSGTDGVLVALGLLVGITCGAISAFATRVERDPRNGLVTAAASPLAYAVTGGAFAGRLAFAVAATNGLGPAIGRFSAQIGVHSQQAWIAALVLMAVSDLVTRAAILWRRRQLVAGGQTWTPSLHSA